MTIKLHNIVAAILFGTMFLLTSCHKDKKDEPEIETRGLTLLFYDICSESSMASNYDADRKEILKAGPSLDLENNTFLMYSVYRTTMDPVLEKLVKKEDGTYDFQVVRIYDRSQYSTDPERLKDVINYTLSHYKNSAYGFIMAAHGTAWSPTFSEHNTSAGRGPAKAIGCDRNDGDSAYDWMDIHELNEALPANVFSFIWFDACYMANIETAYQLRDKAKYYVAYPTEIYIPGMPYDLTIPHLLKPDFDLKSAAKATFDSYNNENKAVTIVVADLSKIGAVAQATNAIYSSFSPLASYEVNKLLKYSRGNTGPFYDFGQYTFTVLEKMNNSAIELWENYSAAMDNMIIYKAASPRNFTGNVIEPEKYSGFSCHNFKDGDSAEEVYYRSLDWYRDAYIPIDNKEE